MASKLQRGEDDRLSSLPDCLLIHILSFLEMKDAVLTGFLSSRWRDLWTFVPNLDFHSSLSRGLIRKRTESSFVTFVDKSLISHSALKIQKFRLRFKYLDKHASDVDLWINFAVRKGVQELDIDLVGCWPWGPYRLPYRLFKCKTLVSLKTNNCTFHVLESPRFCLLTRLSLSRMSFTNEMLQVLLSGCLLLEDLDLGFITFSSDDVLCIFSSLNSRLKYLTVESCEAYGVEVDAPNLHTLKLCITIRDLCSLKDMPSLSEAHLDVSYIWNASNILRISSSIQNLCHAKVLDLSSSCIQTMHTLTFKDLHSYTFKTKCLTLQTKLLQIELPGIANLLWSSPDLETLVINLIPHEYVVVSGCNDKYNYMMKIDFDENEYWESLTVSFRCLVHCLKSVKITNFIRQGSISLCDFTNEINLVRFLLRNAMVLEKITIHSYKKPYSVKIEEWKKCTLKVTQELMATPRASPYVDVMFSNE